MSHTPGGWEWIEEGCQLTIQNVATGAFVLDIWVEGASDYELNISDDNKRLILAAPDLLEALKKIMEPGRSRHDWTCESDSLYNRFQGPCNCGIDAAQAAIAKAEGS